MVPLPDWGQDLGVGSLHGLLVDSACLVPGDQKEFERCDWWSAAFYHLTGAAEVAHEERHGPAHSYAARLRGINPALFDHAWVNRIMLFLRRWTARGLDRTEDDIFGPLPPTDFDLTHDVDAISKTLPIRLKQTAFHLFNATRLSVQRRFHNAVQKLAAAGQATLLPADYWCFPTIRKLEEHFGVRSAFHFYSGRQHRPSAPRKWILDPTYDVTDPRLSEEIRSLHAGGWEVGMHQAFDTWRDSSPMKRERQTLELAAGAPVERCRQHWLRFSWHDTWRAQQEAGFKLDTTLGFNDRPGFRNGSALRFNPWDTQNHRPMTIDAIPMVLMDSHMYDYQPMTGDERHAALHRWLGEIKAVHGVASVVWHQRVMHPDYGWGSGYRDLLKQVTR